MNNLNSVLIEGNLIKDPSLGTSARGTPVCKFCIASNRYFKSEHGYSEDVSYFDIESWSRLAESCHTLGSKGRGVRIVGRLKQDRWNDQDGKQHSKVIIVAEHVEFRPLRKAEEAATVRGESDSFSAFAAAEIA